MSWSVRSSRSAVFESCPDLRPGAVKEYALIGLRDLQSVTDLRAVPALDAHAATSRRAALGALSIASRTSPSVSRDSPRALGSSPSAAPGRGPVVWGRRRRGRGSGRRPRLRSPHGPRRGRASRKGTVRRSLGAVDGKIHARSRRVTFEAVEALEHGLPGLHDLLGDCQARAATAVPGSIAGPSSSTSLTNAALSPARRLRVPRHGPLWSARRAGVAVTTRSASARPRGDRLPPPSPPIIPSPPARAPRFATMADAAPLRARGSASAAASAERRSIGPSWQSAARARAGGLGMMGGDGHGGGHREAVPVRSNGE